MRQAKSRKLKDHEVSLLFLILDALPHVHAERGIDDLREYVERRYDEVSAEFQQMASQILEWAEAVGSPSLEGTARSNSRGTARAALESSVVQADARDHRDEFRARLVEAAGNAEQEEREEPVRMAAEAVRRAYGRAA